MKSDSRWAFPRDLIALLLLVTMVLWFNDEIVRGGKVPFFGDLGPYFYPMRFNLAQSLQAGELPLWNKYVSAGFPFLANVQAGVFYPPHSLFLLLPFFDAIRFLFVFHYLIAATGGYLLCRQWSYPPHLALIGAILFAFGGMIVSLSNLMDHFQTAVWLPWVVLFGERSLGSQSWKYFSLFTIVLVVQFLAGSPEIYVMSQGFHLLNGLRLKAERTDIPYHKLILSLLGSNTLVAGLAMVQILPTVELFLQSWRSETIAYAKASAWSLNPIGLINLFFLDKEVNPFAFNGLHLYFSQERPLMITLYLGAIALPGLFLWLFTSSSREKVVLLGLSIISLILAMGTTTPVYAFLYHYFPLFGLIRFPEKFFFLANALLIFMTLRGLFAFLQSDDSHSKAALLIFSSICFLLFLLYLFLRVDTGPLSRFIAHATGYPILSTETFGRTSAVVVNLERQIALTFGILLLLFAWQKGKLQMSLFSVLLVALIFFDLASAHRDYLLPLDPELVFRKPKVMDAPDKEPYRLFYIHNLSYLHPNYYRFSKRPFPETVSSVYASLIPNTGVFHGFEYMQELDALGRKPYNLFLNVANDLPPERLYRLLGVLNVKYLYSLQPLPPGEITLLRQFPEYPSWLYRVDRAIPRIYIASKVVADRDSLKSLDRLSSAEFDPFKEVILEEPLSTAANHDFQAQAEILNYAHSKVTIRASLNGLGVLVLADSFYPGWRVYVDGEKKEILRANFFFRAVRLPPGEHLVEFRYQPFGFKLGLLVSLATAGLLLVFILLHFIKARSQRSRLMEKVGKDSVQ